MAKDLSNLEETQRAIDDFRLKKEEIDRMIRQLSAEKLDVYEDDAISAFINVSSRYGVIIQALKKRKIRLETT